MTAAPDHKHIHCVVFGGGWEQGGAAFTAWPLYGRVQTAGKSNLISSQIRG